MRVRPENQLPRVATATDESALGKPPAAGRTQLGEAVRLGGPQDLLSRPAKPASGAKKGLKDYEISTRPRQQSSSLSSSAPSKDKAEKRSREHSEASSDDASPRGEYHGRGKYQKSAGTPHIGQEMIVIDDDDEDEAPAPVRSLLDLVTLEGERKASAGPTRRHAATRSAQTGDDDPMPPAPEGREKRTRPSTTDITQAAFEDIILTVMTFGEDDAHYASTLAEMRRQDRLNMSSASRQALAAALEASEHLDTPAAVEKLFLFLQRANGTHELPDERRRATRNSRCRFSLHGASDNLSQALIGRALAMVRRDETTASELATICGSLGILFSRDIKQPTGAELFAQAIAAEQGLQGDKLNAVVAGFDNGLIQGKNLWTVRVTDDPARKGAVSTTDRMRGPIVFSAALRKALDRAGRDETVAAMVAAGQRFISRDADPTPPASSSSSSSSSSTSVAGGLQEPTMTTTSMLDAVLQTRLNRALHLAKAGGCSRTEAHAMGAALGMRLSTDAMDREVDASIDGAVPPEEAVDTPLTLLRAWEASGADEAAYERFTELLRGLFSTWHLTEDRVSSLEGMFDGDLSVFTEE
ncbi:MAG TPA: hypothetical protein VLJ86_09930 [Ramlibacter sp.]|nr:hypothetical protein [Ramlibacter sp.]